MAALSESRVKELARDGAITAARIGRLWRFEAADVEAYLASTRAQRAVARQQRLAPAVNATSAVLEPIQWPAGFEPVDFGSSGR